MINGEHLVSPFNEKFPAEEVPVLVDGQRCIYGGGALTIVKHLCFRNPRLYTIFKLKDNAATMDNMFLWINKNVRPLTQRIQKLKLLDLT